MSVDRSRLPVPGPSRGFRFPEMARRRLANGVDVRAVTHDAVPLATIVVLVPGGSAADPPDLPGVTSLTADLLDEGVPGLDALGVADALARLGGELETDVGPDATLVGLTTLAHSRDAGLRLLADILARPTLAGPDLDRLRKLRLERLRQLRDHAPAVAERAFARALYHDHPYGHLGLGTEDAIGGLTVEAVRAHHAAMFRPDGVTVVVAGPGPADRLIEAAERAFGPWRASASGTADRPAGGLEPPPLDPLALFVIVPRPGAAQTEIRIGHVSAPRSTPDYHALVLLNTVLGGQFVSRTNLNLREQKGYTYGVRTGFDLRRGRGPFVLQTSVQTEVTAPAVREALREIADVREARPVTGEELDMARAAVTRGYSRGFETVQQVARAAAQLALYDLPDDYFTRFVPAVEDVSCAEVAEAARRHLDPDRLCTVLVGDVDRIRAPMTALGLGDPVVLPA